MCGRFTRKENFQQLAKLLGMLHLPDLPPHYNIAPSQFITCVRFNPESQDRELVDLKWGFVPSWAHDPSLGHKMINARAETVADKPSFRKAFQERRCIILADGFYEWKRVGQGKQPYYIHFTDNRPFAFAGLWERWEQGNTPSLDSCAILTTTPNILMESLHHRMPVILHPKDYVRWLDPTLHERQSFESILQPFPSTEMEAYPVSTLVNNPRYESRACYQSIAEE